MTGATKRAIIVVSGLPRSGTSVMMKMLQAGGIELVSDGIRAPDDDNPEGYHEYERVKHLAVDTACLDDCAGKAVKIISELLPHLPDKFDYKIVFMRRHIAEIVDSQAVMLRRRNETDSAGDRVRSLLVRHLNETMDLLSGMSNVRVLYANYNRTIAQPRATVDRLAAFLQRPLDLARMEAAVNPGLYRNKRE